ncbi:unnamed protein product [Dovyalis caffra]|uniref:Uncharacterized protein n=1 Tax=Dovyalis caffra TaxID=77055 RepID=A0AAV1SHU3_9ROSI|nr:unnamed protein product [Dovyalis caffra]
MARRKLKLCPMMGKPKEPGGTFFELILVRRRYSGRMNRRSMGKNITGLIVTRKICATVIANYDRLHKSSQKRIIGITGNAYKFFHKMLRPKVVGEATKKVFLTHQNTSQDQLLYVGKKRYHSDNSMYVQAS